MPQTRRAGERSEGHAETGLKTMRGATEFGTGGYYELVIDLGSHDERLTRAVDALWSHADLATAEGVAANENLATEGAARHPAWRHGVARLPNGARIPCRSFAEVIAGPSGEKAYVVFALPMAALERACATDRPVAANAAHAATGGLDTAWRERLENWLAELGAHVDAAVPFGAAYIGFLPFPIGEEELAESLFAREVPAERYLAYLYRWEDDLRYFPTNCWS